MGNTTKALIFVMLVNVLLFISQAAMTATNPDGAIYFHCETSFLASFGDCQNLNTGNAINQLPTLEGSISPTTGNLFTDTFAAVKNWFLDTTGLNYLFAILGAPYNVLKIMGLPQAFVYAIGTMWYGITLFLIISFFRGND